MAKDSLIKLFFFNSLATSYCRSYTVMCIHHNKNPCKNECDRAYVKPIKLIHGSYHYI